MRLTVRQLKSLIKEAITEQASGNKIYIVKMLGKVIGYVNSKEDAERMIDALPEEFTVRANLGKPQTKDRSDFKIEEVSELQSGDLEDYFESKYYSSY